MEIESILEEVTQVFRKVLDNDTIVLKRETVASDIEEWDSLTNIQLIVAVEKRFKIRFTAAEIRDFNNVGELCDAVKAKAQ